MAQMKALEAAAKGGGSMLSLPRNSIQSFSYGKSPDQQNEPPTTIGTEHD